MSAPRPGSPFVSGSAEDGQIVLTRSNGSSEQLPPGLVIVSGVTLTQNNDPSFDLTFDGS